MIGYTCSSSILLTHSNLHWSVSHNTNSFLLVYFGHVFASPEVEAAVDHPHRGAGHYTHTRTHRPPRAREIKENEPNTEITEIQENDKKAGRGQWAKRTVGDTQWMTGKNTLDIRNKDKFGSKSEWRVRRWRPAFQG